MVGFIGGLIGTALGAVGQSRAADASADATRDAARMNNRTQRRVHRRTRKDLKPYRRQGKNALRGLRNFDFDADYNANVADLERLENFGRDEFETSPGYEFRLQQGMDAIDRGAAARGMTFSGNTLQAYSDYNQGMASQEFGNAYNRLLGRTQIGMANRAERTNRELGNLNNLAGTGMSAAGMMSGSGQNMANAMSANNNMAAQAAGNAAVAQSNALSGAINNGLGLFAGAQMGAFGPNPGLGIQPQPNALIAQGYTNNGGVWQ